MQDSQAACWDSKSIILNNSNMKFGETLDGIHFYTMNELFWCVCRVKSGYKQNEHYLNDVCVNQSQTVPHDTEHHNAESRNSEPCGACPRQAKS
jgi:hypothetical protein